MKEKICSFTGRPCKYVAYPNQPIEQCGAYQYLSKIPRRGNKRIEEERRLEQLGTEALERKCYMGLYE